jgi:hypothetical protein
MHNSHDPGNFKVRRRLIRIGTLLVCCIGPILLVVACDHSPLDPIQVQVPGAIPDRSEHVETSLPHDGLSFPAAPSNDDAKSRTSDQIAMGSRGCIACHGETDHKSMHQTEVLGLTCADCHGGHADLNVPANLVRGSVEFESWKRTSHVAPRLPDLWKEPGNPRIPGALTLQESDDFIRFINPGDLRAAESACGACHNEKSYQYAVSHVRSSMMAHGAMLWEAALYNNGSIPRKNAVYGEFYDLDAKPAGATADPLPTDEQTRLKGMLARLLPLPRWEITQPGNILRVFERGGQGRPITGIPSSAERSGRPDVKLSSRGLGTELRTDPVFLGLQKTRLLDPTLNLFGTNDHAGDYRGSGCSACHVVYANDRSPVHSPGWSGFGNAGESFSVDPMINPGTVSQPYSQPWQTRASRGSGLPVKHSFVKSPPTSSCIVCHVHPGNNVVNAYLGYTWWDNETDGEFMYPPKQKDPTPEEQYLVSQSNPEGSAARGMWSRPEFLAKVGTPEFNQQLKHTQFADFHGHGWVFRAVFKQDRHGNLLDSQGQIVEQVDSAKMKAAVDFQSTTSSPPPGVPVHLKDIHLEKGMQCVDCHFRQDAHGDGNLYGETRAAVEVDCVDCHGTPQQPAVIAEYLRLKSTLKKSPRTSADKRNNEKINSQMQALLPGIFSGSAAPVQVDDDELAYRADLLAKHFQWDAAAKRLVQIPALGAETLPHNPNDPNDQPTGWNIVQVADTVSPDSWWADPANNAGAPSCVQKARFAHTVRRDGVSWGGSVPSEDATGPMALAHSNTRLSCYACHSSWNTSCFGCHLPMRANQMKPMNHNEGLVTRNYTNYNFQTLRDDVFMLGVDSTVKSRDGGKTHQIVPIRSACAVMVSSQNANRDWTYAQQQTVSAEGFAGTAFSPYFPHTVRGIETKQCTDCHLSALGDNNAIMAELLMQGTHAVNFIGHYAWVGEGAGGVQAVAVTEHDEPQAVIGSKLHRIAYPDNYRLHQEKGRQLTEAYGHSGTVLDLQLRGEYLYTACGPDGFIAYDVANIDNKDFSQRIITAPVSPLGQRFYVPSRYATSICSPSTMALDPTRPHLKENEEQSVSLLYAFLYLTDREEGLIVIGNPLDSPKPGVSTLLDGNPENNFLGRALTFNPDGLLTGARSMSLLGN